MVIPLLKRALHTGTEVWQIEEVELEGRADPETHPGHNDLVPVVLVLDDRTRAIDEQRSGDEDEVAGHDGTGDSAEQSGGLRQ